MSWKDVVTYEVLPAELTFETDIPEVIFALHKFYFNII